MLASLAVPGDLEVIGEAAAAAAGVRLSRAMWLPSLPTTWSQTSPLARVVTRMTASLEMRRWRDHEVASISSWRLQPRADRC